ncbi:ArsR family transcriptional regulator [Natronocella acetinitrilica]|uniref:ArsR family transcriptional regulator n=1 Tax=Natronocella acetinitrilica TaxID=414046 RepID=A0AAE3KBG3_9GAMM|nr:metalloregulator ArsR/SmtB family transcription factor [Natronocella acetinitrilica]MCP1673548.1 ArsR family transcriptional regulator [Natronocella acetinitrilica]
MPADTTTHLDVDAMREAAGEASGLLRMLAHEDRLLLLCQLTEGELCVSDLEERLDIRQPSLSQQLGVLRRQQLVTTRREGRHIYYRIADARAQRVLATLYELFCNHTGDAS